LHTIFSQFSSIHSNIKKSYAQLSHEIVYKNFITRTQSCFTFIHVTHHVNTAVMPWHCIRATGHPTRVFSCIFSISPDGCRDSDRKHAKTTFFQVRDFLPSPTTNDPLSFYTNQDNTRNVQSSASRERLFVICWTLCRVILTHFLIYCLSFLLVTCYL